LENKFSAPTFVSTITQLFINNQKFKIMKAIAEKNQLLQIKIIEQAFKTVGKTDYQKSVLEQARLACEILKRENPDAIDDFAVNSESPSFSYKLRTPFNNFKKLSIAKEIFAEIEKAGNVYDRYIASLRAADMRMQLAEDKKAIDNCASIREITEPEKIDLKEVLWYNTCTDGEYNYFLYYYGRIAGDKTWYGFKTKLKIQAEKGKVSQPSDCVYTRKDIHLNFREAYSWE
jgi:hypothetical protein